MPSLVPFDATFEERLIALWRAMHPDWDWLDNPENRQNLFKGYTEGESYLLLNGDSVIAFASGTILPDRYRNRYIWMDALPEACTAEAVRLLFSPFEEIDRDETDVWHVFILDAARAPVLAPLVEAAGFVLDHRLVRMEWEHESVVLEPPPDGTEFTFYRGGDTAMDQAIVDLHNKAYRPARLVVGVDLESLWRDWPGLTEREYVLAWIDGKLAGYAEWLVTGGRPVLNSLAAARAWWGTSLAPAAGTRAMAQMWDKGYRVFYASVSTRNAAALKLNQRFGWRVTVDENVCYVRKL